MYQIILLIVLSVLTGSHGYVSRSGNCPTYTGLTPFDYLQFVGDWHAIQQFDPKDPCLKYNINYKSPGKLKVIETAYENPTKLKHTKIHKLKFKGASTSTMKLETENSFFTAKFTVLMTDNLHYAVVFVCKSQVLGHAESLEIWSRETTLSPATLQVIHTHLASVGVNIRGLDVVDQTTCRPTVGVN